MGGYDINNNQKVTNFGFYTALFASKDDVYR